MQIPPILERVSAVIVGNFNPAIFSPAWFALNSLVSKEDADNSRLQMIHPEFCQFEVGQFSVQADLQRFIASCAKQHHEMVRDLVVSTFGSLLKHTPIVGIGINCEVHFDSGDYRVRNLLGEKFAPKSIWGSWGSSLEANDGEPVRSNGLVSLTMREVLHGEFIGHVQANLQPSALPNLGFSGIFVAVNCHYQINADNTAGNVDHLIRIIDENWEKSIKTSESIIDQVQHVTLEIKRKLGSNE